MRIYFLRHIATDNNLNNITQAVIGSLVNEHAKRQFCDELSNMMMSTLSGKGSIAVLYGISERVKETARLVCRHLYDKCYPIEAVIPEIHLNEVDFGVFKGKPEDWQYFNEADGELYDMQRYRQMLIDGKDIEFPEGEDLLTINTRCRLVIDRVEQIIEDCQPNNLIIIGSNRFFRHLKMHLTDCTAAEAFKEKFEHAKLLHICDL